MKKMYKLFVKILLTILLIINQCFQVSIQSANPPIIIPQKPTLTYSDNKFNTQLNQGIVPNFNFKEGSNDADVSTNYQAEYDEFIKRNYIPLFLPKDYMNNSQKLPYTCSCHPNKNLSISYHNLQKGRGCKYCAIEANSKENNYGWKGGVSGLHNYLRKHIKEWKIKSSKSCNYKCVLTQEDSHGEFVLHHLYGYEKILDEILINLNLSIKQNVFDYTEQELKLIEDECLKLHFKYGLGVIMHPKLHKLFHSNYGYGNNNSQQFIEFTNRLKQGDFNDFLKENNLQLNINYKVINVISSKN